MGLCALELVTCCVPSMWCRVQPAYPLISVVGASGSTRRQACPLLTLPSAAHSCFGVSGAACLRKPPVREPMREPRQKCPLLLYDADFKVHGLRILACAARRPRFHLATTAGFGSAALPCINQCFGLASKRRGRCEDAAETAVAPLFESPMV